MNSRKAARIFAASAALVAAPVFAVDGTVLIDQNKALAGNVTPGDAPGFPVTISRPGSYRLSGNLTVPDGETGAIVIAASHVTLDLNGFAILGPTDCVSQMNPCVNQATLFPQVAFGITTDGPQFNITIRNGTIQGLGAGGIRIFFGGSILIEYIHARSNGGTGIDIVANAGDGLSIVQHSTAQRNQGLGIGLSRGAIRYNVVDLNLSSGIALSTGSVANNVVTGNLAGINLGFGASALGNTADDNPAGNIVGGGANLGHNFCRGTGGTC